MRLPHVIQRLSGTLGELWWFTLLMFVTQRFGDLINAVVGLWLVPKYVPADELGAVLPLTSVGALMGLPLGILLVPFMKFLSKYMALQEYGKVKRLLRDTFLFAGGVFLVVSAAAYLLMPFFFERVRVANGSLGFLIIATGIIGALAPIFTTALQALKKFWTLTATGFLAALVRLTTMAVCLPIRGLSGYFVGQIMPALFTMGVAFCSLRPHLNKSVKMVPYWDADAKRIIRYTGWVALLLAATTLQTLVENLTIRQRLPDLDSAAYYMISRFSEIATCLGMSIALVLFPVVSTRHEHDKEGSSKKLLVQAMFGAGLFGGLFAVACAVGGGALFSLKSDWHIYKPFVPHMAFLSIILTLRSGVVYCFTMHQAARERFGHVPWFVAIAFFEIVTLYTLTGYTVFQGILPTTWIDAIAAFNPARLSVILSVMFIFVTLPLIYVVYDFCKRTPKIFPADYKQRK